MNRISASTLLIGLMLLSSVATANDQKKFRVVILSGQSNMAGMKPNLGLTPEIEKLFGDDHVVHFKVASGGKPIRLWLDEWEQLAKRNGIDAKKTRSKQQKHAAVYFAPIVKQYKSLVEKHGEPASVTFCWMQGERDAREGLSAAYEDALKTLIGKLRKELDQPEMSFVIGRLSDFGGPDHKHWAKIRDIQVAVAKADPKGAWVDCDDLNDKKTRDGSPKNDLHYTAEGYELLGRRYIRQMRRLVDGKDPAANGRPE